MRRDGAAAYDNTGCAVSTAGDVNGDGFDDLLLGAFGSDVVLGRNFTGTVEFLGSDGDDVLTWRSGRTRSPVPESVVHPIPLAASRGNACALGYNTQRRAQRIPRIDSADRRNGNLPAPVAWCRRALARYIPSPFYVKQTR